MLAAAPADDRLARTAALRARGNSWDAVADQLGDDADELRASAERAGREFRTLVAAARAEVVSEAFAGNRSRPGESALIRSGDSGHPRA